MLCFQFQKQISYYIKIKVHVNLMISNLMEKQIYVDHYFTLVKIPEEQHYSNVLPIYIEGNSFKSKKLLKVTYSIFSSFI